MGLTLSPTTTTKMKQSALLAVAAIAMSGQGKRDISRSNREGIEIPTKVLYPLPPLEASRPNMSQLNFRWQNQRQARKNRRRAHAAGFQNAFA